MNEKKKTSRIALGAVCLALALVSIFAASFVPGIELTLFAVSSIFTGVMINETDVKGGLLLYTGASVLGLIILPNKLAMIPYIFLFGYYGILKLYMDRIKSRFLQIIVKAAFFAALLSIGLLGFSKLLMDTVTLPDMPVYILIIAGTAFLILYDFVFTFLMGVYMKKVKHKGLDSMKLS